MNVRETLPQFVFTALTTFLISPSSLFAQEAEPSPPPAGRIIGEISDGKPSAKPQPPKKLPQYKIHWTKRVIKNSREVILNRVATPASLPKLEETHRPLTTREIAEREARLRKWERDYRTKLGGIFSVSATIYDHRATLVRWTHRGMDFTAWSNVDWNHLGGFHTFEARGKRYTMLLLSGNQSTKQLRKDQQAGYRATLPNIPKLPPVSRGARYTVTEGDTSDEQAMEFIEAVHDLYDTQKKQLAQAYQQRLKNRKTQDLRREQLRRNPPPKPPLVINYWKKKTPVKKQGNPSPDKTKNPANQGDGKEAR